MKSLILASASAIALTATAASAQTVVYGGGSTLGAPVYRDIYNCAAAPLLVGTNAPTAETVPSGAGGSGGTDTVSQPTALNANCAGAANTSYLFLYAPTGSGAALKAIENGTAIDLSNISTSNKIGWELTDPMTYPENDFSASDAPLPNTAYTFPAGYGFPVQIPTAEVGVAIPVKVTVGGVQLNAQFTSKQLCSIWSGSVTNWNTFTAKTKTLYNPAVNSGVDVNGNPAPTVFANGPNEPIVLAVRYDGSGTTFLFQNYLEYTCKISGVVAQTGSTGNTAAIWDSFLPSAAQANLLDTTATKGSSGEAKTVAATEGAIGYVGTDYALTNSGINSVYLQNGFVTASKAKPYTRATTAGVADTLSVIKIAPTKYTGSYSDTKYGIIPWNNAFAGKVTGALKGSTASTDYTIAGYTFTDVNSCSPNNQAAVSYLINYFFNTANATEINAIYTAAGLSPITGTLNGQPLYAVTHYLLPVVKSTHC